MSFQDTPGEIRWKVHFRSERAAVVRALTTAEGRAGFWAESAEEIDGHIVFRIHNYPEHRARVLRQTPDAFELEYFGTLTAFHLEDSPSGGTLLELRVQVDDETARLEMTPGWVSVLLAMKAAVDFGVDLRNHDPHMAWRQGFADN